MDGLERPFLDKVISLWGAVPMVFGIGECANVCMCACVACVYLSEEVLPLPLSPEAESSRIDSKKQSALSKGTRKID
jgi:hypothetical protein